jgi:hypothetical protein
MLVCKVIVDSTAATSDEMKEFTSKIKFDECDFRTDISAIRSYSTSAITVIDHDRRHLSFIINACNNDPENHYYYVEDIGDCNFIGIVLRDDHEDNDVAIFKVDVGEKIKFLKSRNEFELKFPHVYFHDDDIFNFDDFYIDYVHRKLHIGKDYIKF